MTEKHDTGRDGQAVWAIIPAGGIGVRMSADSPKQYLKILGKVILHHTLARICASSVVSGLVIGLSRHDCCWAKNPFTDTKILGTYEAGEQRFDTVSMG